MGATGPVAPFGSSGRRSPSALTSRKSCIFLMWAGSPRRRKPGWRSHPTSQEEPSSAGSYWRKQRFCRCRHPPVAGFCGICLCWKSSNAARTSSSSRSPSSFCPRVSGI
ncbi:hypothetical protein CALCODRAFT_519498 [Calocera cornea HHB12733]|uniref:Uncharacterized protein n=1 Tax=Calocera cornea HHB12733 TaxID=1353952 RepID=A0A165E8F0_9BASI|nr:hypothetical protein CALCODRAFT_519498 [Calocera cornea HHB12733]